MGIYLRRLIIELDDAKSILSNNSSSLMQGVLMEKASRQFAEEMHSIGTRPYSQYLYREKDRLIWVVNTFSEDAYKEFILPLLDAEYKEIYLENKDATINILKKDLSEITYDKLLKDTFFSNCNRHINIWFKTPTAFKVNNQYQFYPTIEHMLKSLINKFNSCGFESNIEFDEDMEKIEEYISITNYSLKSTKFYLEGIRIPAFVGRLTLKINGPQQLVNLVNLLFKFGEYSGLGIKTAIGMGAVEIIERREKMYIEQAKD